MAQVISVKQDGTGDFTTIQQAVDSAANGDTVLVWPGQYFENVFIDQKAIVLGSLTLTTDEPAFANTTIIDGNNTGSCIYVNYCQDSVKISGFTLEHGSGTSLGVNNYRFGGGIFFYHSTGSAKHCVIKNNVVPGSGGGISVLHSDVKLSGNLIKENHTFLSGGGISISVSSSVLFDSICLNNIYLNYSAQACDIYLALEESSDPIHVCVDTFTVQNPDQYYILSTSGIGVPNENFTYSILHAKIETSNTDLFVSPEGDDANNGLSPDNPLKTIAFALSSIVSDSLHPNTIHLANGSYSFNDGEKFPLNLRSHISLIGEDKDSTVLDASNIIFHLYGNPLTSNYTIKNITFINGNGDVNSTSGFGSFIIISNSDLIMENLLFTENTGGVANCGPINVSDNIILNHVEFYHNHGAKAALRIGMGFGMDGIPNDKPDTVHVNNCIFRGNKPEIDTVTAYGGGAATLGSIVYDSSASIFTNCLFTGFVSEPTNDIGSNAFSSHMGGEAYLVNCTFSDSHWNNLNNDGAPVAVTYGSRLHIYNSILYRDHPAEIYLYTIDEFENYLYIYNSLLEEGIFGIKVYSTYNNIYYDPSNLDVYPEWDTAEPFKYSLLAGSPCIDAGTLYLPPGIDLPEYDLAGNPRVWGASVDMGAYEYGPWVGVSPVGSQQSAVGGQVSVSPNPFSYGTYVSYEILSSGSLNVSIFSSNGMMVRTLVNYHTAPEDKAEIYWDGTGQNGQIMPAGIYFIRLTIDGKEMETVKVVKE